MSIKEYRIVEAKHTGGLASLVNHVIDRGWQPLGGLTVSPEQWYLQPMVRHHETEEAISPIHHEVKAFSGPSDKDQRQHELQVYRRSLTDLELHLIAYDLRQRYGLDTRVVHNEYHDGYHHHSEKL